MNNPARLRLRAFVALAIGAAILWPGCTAVSRFKNATLQIADDFTGADTTLRRKTLLAPFSNESGYAYLDVQSLVVTPLGTFLKSTCKGVLVVTPPGPALSGDKPRPLAGSGAQEPATGDLARTSGVQAVVEGTLVEISAVEEKEGIYGFRSPRKKALVRLHLWIRDTRTGAKLMDESVVRSVPVSDEAWENLRLRHRCSPTVLAGIGTQAGEVLCRSLRKMPWKGMVTAVEGTRVNIAAGSEAGLKNQQVLYLYADGEAIEAGETTYVAPGPKAGRVKITRVEANRSTGVILGKFTGKTGWVMLK